VEVRLSYLADAVTFDLADDGAGFDPGAMLQRAGRGYGLVGMRERAEQLGGRLAVTSAPGAGTTIGLWLPASPS
jgi:signal transduction histidine kinase